MNIYKQLAEGGGYNLPFLLHIFDPAGKTHIHLINDTAPMTYKGQRYEAASFKYAPGQDGDGSLSIGVQAHENLIDLVEDNSALRVEVIGVFNGEAVEETGQYKHRYGQASWDGARLELKMNKDDRGGMTFPALLFSTYNNRGNA
ncbi:MAG: hypothetical protein ACTTKL_07510 [Treponema sp.]